MLEDRQEAVSCDGGQRGSVALASSSTAAQCNQDIACSTWKKHAAYTYYKPLDVVPPSVLQ